MASAWYVGNGMKLLKIVTVSHSEIFTPPYAVDDASVFEDDDALKVTWADQTAYILKRHIVSIQEG